MSNNANSEGQPRLGWCSEIEGFEADGLMLGLEAIALTDSDKYQLLTQEVQ